MHLRAVQRRERIPDRNGRVKIVVRKTRAGFALYADRPRESKKPEDSKKTEDSKKPEENNGI